MTDTTKSADELIAEAEANAVTELSQGESSENILPDTQKTDDTSALPTDNASSTEDSSTDGDKKEAPATDETKTDTQSVETKTDETPSNDTDEEIDLSQLKPKGQDRIRDLANKAAKVPELEKELKRLQNLMGVGATDDATLRKPSDTRSAPQNVPSNQLKGTPWDTSDTDNSDTRELTEDEIRQQAREEARIEQRNTNILNTLKYDVSVVEDTYPELREPTTENPNPDYDPQLAKNVTDWYNTLFAKNHNLRLKDFVDSIMSLKRKGEEQGRKQAEIKTQEVLKKQTAEQIVDPSGAPSSVSDSVEVRLKNASSSKDLEELEKLLPHA